MVQTCLDTNITVTIPYCGLEFLKLALLRNSCFIDNANELELTILPSQSLVVSTLCGSHSQLWRPNGVNTLFIFNRLALSCYVSIFLLY